MSEEVKNTDYVLEVENLHTCFHTESGDVNAVNGLSMTLEAGKTLGIVGESGSGKSVTAYSIIPIFFSNHNITVWNSNLQIRQIIKIMHLNIPVWIIYSKTN